MRSDRERSAEQDNFVVAVAFDRELLPGFV
jgi:hypothetical protein